MPATENEQGPLSPIALGRALEEHSVEGIQILYSRPAPMLHTSLALVAALVLAALAWAFVGHADVIVSAPGILSPEDEVRRVYTPAAGELEGMLVREGDPVRAGEPIARVRSREAISLAANARQAEFELAAMELEEDQFPATLALLEQELALISADLATKQQQLDRREVSGKASLRQKQLA